MKRPVGIVLSAIALGLIAVFLLLLALGGIATTLNGPRFAEGGGGAGLPSPEILKAVMFFMTLVYLALAAWSTFTLMGLLRMRAWARVSAMVIAAGLCGLGLFFTLAMMAASSMVSNGSFPIPPNVPSALFHKIIVFMGSTSLAVAALSGGWLIHLARRRTRQTFEEASAQRENGVPPHSSAADPATHPHTQFPVPRRRSTPRQPEFNPLTDFTVARPLTPPNPPPAPEPFEPRVVPYPEADHWQSRGAQQTLIARRSGRPVSITILSVLALLYAFVAIVGIVSPVPGFIFGFVVGGWPFHLYSLVLAAAMAICGLGMLRLQRPAWQLSFVLLGIHSLNFLAFLLPGARARYIAYLAEQQTKFGGPQAQLPANIMATSIAMAMAFGLMLMAFFAIVLWRARWTFEPAPSPPANEQSASD